ncbi:MAG: hypothetical protein ACYS0E_05350 [Planctomycetota bacterium]|jgi:hypothetical protein
MQKRSDPLIPILGSAVSLVVLGAILLVFYPRVSSWFAQDEAAVIQPLVDLEEEVPLWKCTSTDGVAMLIEPMLMAGDGTDPALDSMLEGGPYRYLRLTVYNFDTGDSYRLELPGNGFDSPEGGARLLPAAARVRPGLSAVSRTVLSGLGSVPVLEVPPGRHGQILLVTTADVTARTAFVSGELRFERRKVTRYALAAWRERPEFKTFQDF